MNEFEGRISSLETGLNHALANAAAAKASADNALHNAHTYSVKQDSDIVEVEVAGLIEDFAAVEVAVGEILDTLQEHKQTMAELEIAVAEALENNPNINYTFQYGERQPLPPAMYANKIPEVRLGGTKYEGPSSGTTDEDAVEIAVGELVDEVREIKTSPDLLIVADHPDYIPEYAHDTDAGMDLRSAEDKDIPSGIHSVDVGIRVSIPEGYFGMVVPRSGLSRDGITVANSPGIIDEGYRGKVKVLVRNENKNTFKVLKGDRIAQLLIVPVVRPRIWVGKAFPDDVEDTERGTRGFGSTGV